MTTADGSLYSKKQDEKDETVLIAKVCLLAGQIILQNGGETYRVEDTMTRIAAAYGRENTHSYVTPTGLLFTIDGSSQLTKLIRISARSTNLIKVSLVNDISRRISSGELTAEAALLELRQVETSLREYRSGSKILAAAVASACFLLMFQGSWHDFVPVFIIGGLGFLCYISARRIVSVIFLAEFLAAIAIGTLSIVAVQVGAARDLDIIIIGAVMPLVPGLPITNAVRDLMAGHLVSGLSKGAEAFLTAFAIGAGIAAVLSFY
ncbi:threonine/serine exporter family protein [Paenibacillus sp. HB172176]|uniref:threonine/serine exporter family protein n=1 Tax=Paenibacillus sp. HB172176 TaxID=2493690 RepID=UPI00143C87D9|nr:threonine/serine exporter family protein [Paenibacillus sp. HB172176]